MSAGRAPSGQALAVPATPANAVDGPSGFDPSRGDLAREEWFADRGNFWGTIQPLLVCARCGRNEHKRNDEPRHFQQIFTPFMHQLCDDCWDELPENGCRRYAIATETRRAETTEIGSVEDEGAAPKGIAQ